MWEVFMLHFIYVGPFVVSFNNRRKGIETPFWVTFEGKNTLCQQMKHFDEDLERFLHENSWFFFFVKVQAFFFVKNEPEFWLVRVCFWLIFELFKTK
jgi:hypothetical protein